MSEATTTTTTIGFHPSKLSPESRATLRILRDDHGLYVLHFEPLPCRVCSLNGETGPDANLPVRKTAWSSTTSDPSIAAHKSCAESRRVTRSSAQARSVQVLGPLWDVIDGECTILHPQDTSAEVMSKDGTKEAWFFAMPENINAHDPNNSLFYYGRLDEGSVSVAKKKAATMQDKVPADWHDKRWQQLKDLSEKEEGLENTASNDKDTDASRLLGFDVITFTPGLQEPFTDEDETPAERDGRLWDEEQ